jgi:hypothetical protein
MSSDTFYANSLGYCQDASFYSGGTYLKMGGDGSPYVKSWITFASVAIPQGSTIDSVYIHMRNYTLHCLRVKE